LNKYQDWLNDALKMMNKDFSNKVFMPKNESDIKCHLYHTLLQTKSLKKGLDTHHIVVSEFKYENFERRFDLALCRWKENENKIEPRLLIEIKETSRDSLPADEVNKRIRKDIDKLREYRKLLEENKEDKNILDAFKEPAIIFFFRGAGRDGIPTKTNQDLEKLKDHEDIKEIIDELCEIRGIGVWTAELTMVRGMQKLEAIPADDLCVRRWISRYYSNDRKISGEEARRIAEKWGKWKGLASYYLLIAGILGLNSEKGIE
jgi:hypothetical protein